MSRMGLFRTTIEIESWDQRGRRRAVPDTLVDTGSEYTWVPREVLESLGTSRSSLAVSERSRSISRRSSFFLFSSARVMRVSHVSMAAAAMAPAITSMNNGRV